MTTKQHEGTIDLPEDDPTIALLSATERDLVGKMWLARARAELSAGATFAVLARRLIEQGVPFEITLLATRAIGDEVRHAEICRRVAACYLGTGASWPEAQPAHEPSFGVAGPELTTALHVVVNSCMSETIGSSFLRTCFVNAGGPVVRAALQHLLRDEIVHARLGWAYLAWERVAPLRPEIARAVPALLRTCRGAWLASEGIQNAPPAHGGLPRETLVAVVEEAIEQLVLPGLRHVGIPLA